MKIIIRFFVIIAVVIFTLVILIKIIKKCSWKDAVGIVEELCKEFDGCCL